MRRALTAVTLVAELGTAAAADAPLPAHLDEILSAHRSGDAVRLRLFASRDEPDPWLVADALCAGGEFEAAAAFAAACPRADVARLPEHVEARRGRRGDVLSRLAVDAAQSRLAAGRADAALFLLALVPCGEEPVAAMRALSIRGDALRSLGRPVDAALSHRAAGSAMRAIGWLAGEARSLDEEGRAWLLCRRDDDAVQAFQSLRHLADRRDAPMREVVEKGIPRERVAVIESAVPGVAKAEQAVRSAAEAGDRPREARALAALSRVLIRGERRAEALTAAERAMELADRKADPELWEACLDQYGDAVWAATSPKIRETLELILAVKDEGGDEREILAALARLANHHLNRYREELCAETASRALALARKLGNRRTEAFMLRLLGFVDGRAKRIPEALARFEESLSIARELGDAGLVFGALRGLSIVHDDAGDLANSILVSEQVLELRPGDAGRQGHTARRLLRFGKWEAGLCAAASSVEGFRTTFRGYDSLEGAVARTSYSSGLDPGVAAAVQRRDAIAAHHFLEHSRAQEMVEELRWRSTDRERSPRAELAQADAAARTRQAAAALALRAAVEGGDRGEIGAASLESAAARREAEAVSQRIRREATYGSFALPAGPDALHDVSARLGPHDAYVAFQFVEDRRLRTVAALVVRPRFARVVNLGDPRTIGESCAALTAAAADPASDWETAAANVARAVIDPLHLGPDVERVLVAPHAELETVPFALLLPGRDVCFVPSATAHGLLAARGEARGEGVLAVGDPDYDADAPLEPDAVASRSARRLARIPASGVEAREVGDVVLTRGDATEERLRGALASRPRWRAVHLAGHGLADAENPLAGALALTPSPGDDGFLTALEVYRSDVAADLVVLSGCETGKGMYVKGEGTFGLTSAFLCAGAPRVLVSMWPVDDEATAALMARFYEAFKRGVPAARALREAQAHVRSQPGREHPYRWAAWALWGLAD